MNWLAHLILAGPDPAVRAGSVLADIVKGEARSTLPEDVMSGIVHHQRIDAWTDRHEVFRRSMARIPFPRRRFAGILIDIYYDHFLSINWKTFSDRPMREFIDQCYAQLQTAVDAHAPTAQPVLARMREEDWLAEYGTLAGLERTLDRISLRLNQPGVLTDSLDDLLAGYGGMEEEFLEFFPALLAFATSTRPGTVAPRSLRPHRQGDYQGEVSADDNG